jgi:hypothetical protein
VNSVGQTTGVRIGEVATVKHQFVACALAKARNLDQQYRA